MISIINPSTWEVEEGRTLGAQGQPVLQKKFQESQVYTEKSASRNKKPHSDGLLLVWLIRHFESLWLMCYFHQQCYSKSRPYTHLSITFSFRNCPGGTVVGLKHQLLWTFPYLCQLWGGIHLSLPLQAEGHSATCALGIWAHLGALTGR